MSLKDLTARIQSQVMGNETGLKTKKGNLKLAAKKKTKKDTNSVKNQAGNLMNKLAACNKTLT